MPDQILILVVEDEDLVRLVIVDALEDAGFEVEHAAAALAILRAHASRIHVPFTDIHMPGEMNGLILAHHAAKHWPNVALLLTSAGPRPAQPLPKNSRFLPKPYRHDHIIRHIRELAAAA